MKLKTVIFVLSSLCFGVLANGNVSAQPPLKTINIPGHATGVSYSGRYIYVVDNLSLLIFSVNDPTNPVAIDSFPLPSFAIGVTGINGAAYVADGYSGLRIISNSPRPPPSWYESTVKLENFTTDVATDIEKSLTCATTSGYFFNDGGFHVLQDSQIVGAVKLPENATGVALSGNYAFVADGSGGMIVIDISVPETPQIVGVTGAGGDIADVAVDGMKVFAADRVNGLVSIDATDPANPIIVGSAYAPGAADVSLVTNKDLVANKALVAAGSAGIHVVNVTNFAAPFLIALLPVPGSAADVAGMANIIYVADEIAGLVLLAMPADIYPYIKSVSEAQTLNGETSATVRAEVKSENGVSINRVWMEITPPDSATAPITVDMAGSDSNTVYEGTFASFEIKGTYTITVQATDNQGGRSVSMGTTITQNGAAPTPDSGGGGGGGSGCFLDVVLGD